jgi:nucleoside-diphosphate-sugar epimerase
MSLNEIKNIVLKYFPEVEFKYTESRPGEVAETRANPRPLRTLGWHTKISIERGINNCFEQLKGEI